MLAQVWSKSVILYHIESWDDVSFSWILKSDNHYSKHYGRLAILRNCNKFYHSSHIFKIIDSHNIEFTLKHSNLFLLKTPKKTTKRPTAPTKGQKPAEIIIIRTQESKLKSNKSKKILQATSQNQEVRPFIHLSFMKSVI